MSEDLIVRKYSKVDYSSVQQNLKEGGIYFEQTDNENCFNEKIERNPGSILVAELAGEVVGNVMVMEDGWGSFLFRLAVRKNHRNQDIGLKLAESAETYLKEKGYRDVNILVSEDETELKELYKRWGYKEGNLYRWMYKEF